MKRQRDSNSHSDRNNNGDDSRNRNNNRVRFSDSYEDSRPQRFGGGGRGGGGGGRGFRGGGRVRDYDRDRDRGGRYNQERQDSPVDRCGDGEYDYANDGALNDIEMAMEAEIESNQDSADFTNPTDMTYVAGEHNRFRRRFMPLPHACIRKRNCTEGGEYVQGTAFPECDIMPAQTVINSRFVYEGNAAFHSRYFGDVRNDTNQYSYLKEELATVGAEELRVNGDLVFANQGKVLQFFEAYARFGEQVMKRPQYRHWTAPHRLTIAIVKEIRRLNLLLPRKKGPQTFLGQRFHALAFEETILDPPMRPVERRRQEASSSINRRLLEKDESASAAAAANATQPPVQTHTNVLAGGPAFVAPLSSTLVSNPAPPAPKYTSPVPSRSPSQTREARRGESPGAASESDEFFTGFYYGNESSEARGDSVDDAADAACSRSPSQTHGEDGNGEEAEEHYSEHSNSEDDDQPDDGHGQDLPPSGTVGTPENTGHTTSSVSAAGATGSGAADVPPPAASTRAPEDYRRFGDNAGSYSIEAQKLGLIQQQLHHLYIAQRILVVSTQGHLELALRYLHMHWVDFITFDLIANTFSCFAFELMSADMQALCRERIRAINEKCGKTQSNPDLSLLNEPYPPWAAPSLFDKEFTVFPSIAGRLRALKVDAQAQRASIPDSTGIFRQIPHQITIVSMESTVPTRPLKQYLHGRHAYLSHFTKIPVDVVSMSMEPSTVASTQTYFCGRSVTHAFAVPKPKNYAAVMREMQTPQAAPSMLHRWRGSAIAYLYRRVMTDRLLGTDTLSVFDPSVDGLTPQGRLDPIPEIPDDLYSPGERIMAQECMTQMHDPPPVGQAPAGRLLRPVDVVLCRTIAELDLHLPLMSYIRDMRHRREAEGLRPLTGPEQVLPPNLALQPLATLNVVCAMTSIKRRRAIEKTVLGGIAHGLEAAMIHRNAMHIAHCHAYATDAPTFDAFADDQYEVRFPLPSIFSALGPVADYVAAEKAFLPDRLNVSLSTRLRLVSSTTSPHLSDDNPQMQAIISGNVPFSHSPSQKRTLIGRLFFLMCNNPCPAYQPRLPTSTAPHDTTAGAKDRVSDPGLMSRLLTTPAAPPPPPAPAPAPFAPHVSAPVRRQGSDQFIVGNLGENIDSWRTKPSATRWVPPSSMIAARIRTVIPPQLLFRQSETGNVDSAQAVLDNVRRTWLDINGSFLFERIALRGGDRLPREQCPRGRIPAWDILVRLIGVLSGMRDGPPESHPKSAAMSLVGAFDHKVEQTPDNLFVASLSIVLVNIDCCAAAYIRRRLQQFGLPADAIDPPDQTYLLQPYVPPFNLSDIELTVQGSSGMHNTEAAARNEIAELALGRVEEDFILRYAIELDWPALADRALQYELKKQYIKLQDAPGTPTFGFNICPYSMALRMFHKERKSEAKERNRLALTQTSVSMYQN